MAESIAGYFSGGMPFVSPKVIKNAAPHKIMLHCMPRFRMMEFDADAMPRLSTATASIIMVVFGVEKKEMPIPVRARDKYIIENGVVTDKNDSKKRAIVINAMPDEAISAGGNLVLSQPENGEKNICIMGVINVIFPASIGLMPLLHCK